MSLFEIILDKIYEYTKYLIIMLLLVFGVSYVVTKNIDINEKLKILNNQEQQMEELLQNQAYVLSLLNKYQEANLRFIELVANDVENKTKKPSYAYLKSVTTYIFRPENVLEMLDEGIVARKKLKGEGIKGHSGTGIVVKEKNGYKYILTNKHVCDIQDTDTCFILNNGNIKDPVKLEFVKRIESHHDLSLWRTNAYLPNLKEIKGINVSYPQERVFSVGNYLGFPFIYTEGTVAGNSGGFVIFNTPCTYGCSGSGVFNTEGELIGVIFATFKIGTFDSDSSKALSIDGDVVRLFLKDLLED